MGCHQTTDDEMGVTTQPKDSKAVAIEEENDGQGKKRLIKEGL